MQKVRSDGHCKTVLPSFKTECWGWITFIKKTVLIFHIQMRYRYKTWFLFRIDQGTPCSAQYLKKVIDLWLVLRQARKITSLLFWSVLIPVKGQLFRMSHGMFSSGFHQNQKVQLSRETYTDVPNFWQMGVIHWMQLWTNA